MGSLSFSRIILFRPFFLGLLIFLAVSAAAQDNSTDREPEDPSELRKLFLPENLQPFAGSDMFLPISSESSVPPVGFLRSSYEILNIDETSSVCIIGRATGFAAAFFAETAADVFVVELDSSQNEKNLRVWQELEVENISSISYPDFFGSPEFEGFDAIMVHGTLEEIPWILSQALAPGGILLAPLSNTRDVQMTLRIERGSGGWKISTGTTSFFSNRPIDLMAY